MTWVNGLSAMSRFFLVTGASSVLILIIQTVLALFGADGEGGDIDAGTDTFDADMESGDLDVTDAGVDGQGIHEGFAQAPVLVSLRGVLAFVAVGSFTALALMRISPVLAVLGALAGGLLSMWVMSRMVFGLSKLAQSGNLRVSRAIGLTAEAYIPIPAEGGGLGKVTVLLQERLCELDAVSRGGAIKTGEQVFVVGVRQEDDVLIVEPLEKKEPRLVWESDEEKRG